MLEKMRHVSLTVDSEEIEPIGLLAVKPLTLVTQENLPVINV
jgi:hypothetical protein